MRESGGSTLSQLIEGGAIPPFVYCYPPRSAYRPLEERWSVDRIWEIDRSNSLTQDLNVYIHVPFCRYKCGFCNLYTVLCTDEQSYDDYVNAVCRELLLNREVIEQRRLRTLYIGGGTPSLLGPGHFERMFATLEVICPDWRGPVEEVCIEASPDSIVDSEIAR